jgi:hypothetical protein
MCGIVGSYNVDVLFDLYERNSYRGDFSHSLTEIKKDNSFSINKKYERIVVSDISNKDSFHLVHSQSPTSTNSNIHPANINGSYLWHNGLIKSFDLKRIQNKHNVDEEWDTILLLKEINLDFNNLSIINGSFACFLFLNEKFYVFRNQLAPLYFNNEFDFSSTKIDGLESIKPNVIFEIDFVERTMKDVFEFKTFELPYILEDL